MPPLFGRLIAEERGQDLVEYALLTTLIALAGAAAFNLMIAAIGFTYGSRNGSINSLWQTPPAAGS